MAAGFCFRFFRPEQTHQLHAANRLGLGGQKKQQAAHQASLNVQRLFLVKYLGGTEQQYMEFGVVCNPIQAARRLFPLRYLS